MIHTKYYHIIRKFQPHLQPPSENQNFQKREKKFKKREGKSRGSNAYPKRGACQLMGQKIVSTQHTQGNSTPTFQQR